MQYASRVARTVYYAAVSLDGFIAANDGGVSWLDAYNSPELGYERFLAGVGAVVLGRTTYEQSLTFGPWPYPGRLGLVVTERPIDSLPEQTRTVTVAELAAALDNLRAHATGDVWIVGGGRTARACLDAGRVDELELYTIPIALGSGVPLLAPSDRSVPLQLLATQRFANDVQMSRYAVERGSVGVLPTK